MIQGHIPDAVLSDIRRVKTNFHVTISSARLLREKIYLLGYYWYKITGNKFPSNKDVLSVLFFNLCMLKLTLRESSRLALQEVIAFGKKHEFQLRKLETAFQN